MKYKIIAMFLCLTFAAICQAGAEAERDCYPLRNTPRHKVCLQIHAKMMAQNQANQQEIDDAYRKARAASMPPITPAAPPSAASMPAHPAPQPSKVSPQPEPTTPTPSPSEPQNTNEHNTSQPPPTSGGFHIHYD